MDFDLIVAGGGPVGVALARAAQGLSVALVAHQAPAQVSAPDMSGVDARVYALSPGNVDLLRALGVWEDMPPERLAPVYAMRIFGDDGRSEIAFDAFEAGVPALAWTVEDRVLQNALWRSVETHAGVRIFSPAECAGLELSRDRALVLLKDGRELAGRLIVAADGANSFVRREAGIATDERPYGQAALVANFACQQAHGGTAFQWFQGAGVLALLPLPGKHVSMIWSLPSADAEAMTRLDPTTFSQAVEQACHAALGGLSLVTPPRSYALRRLSARRMVEHRVALVGDAAHVIHPLAGQGLNLGLQDARALAAVLEERETVRDPGDLRLLRRYERRRAAPILSMDATVHGLFRLFGAQGGTISRLRNAGLNLTDRLPVLKNMLMRHAMS